MQPTPQAYWDPQRKEIQVVWGIGGRRRHFRLPPHPANLDVLTVEAINDIEVAIFYGREGSRPQWVQVVGIMSGGVHLSTNWQAYLSRLARRTQEQQSLVRFAQQQQRREQQECERQRREAEASAREQREQQRRALAVRPRTEAPTVRRAVPSRKDAQSGLPTNREFIESRQRSSFTTRMSLNVMIAGRVFRGNTPSPTMPHRNHAAAIGRLGPGWAAYSRS